MRTAAALWGRFKCSLRSSVYGEWWLNMRVLDEDESSPLSDPADATKLLCMAFYTWFPRPEQSSDGGIAAYKVQITNAKADTQSGLQSSNRTNTNDSESRCSADANSDCPFISIGVKSVMHLAGLPRWGNISSRPGRLGPWSETA